MKRNKSVLKIPLNKIEEGIKLCLQNALQFCSDADILINQQSSEHALGLCILATEELGKAIMLKEKAAYARKRSEEAVLFERVNPECFFEAKREDLKKSGFKKAKINPFYDHLSKLLYANNIVSMVGSERTISSLEGKWFKTIEEMMEIEKRLEEQMPKATTDLRELVFYVDYNQKEEKWSMGTIKVNSAAVKGYISDIRKSISLIASWF